MREWRDQQTDLFMEELGQGLPNERAFMTLCIDAKFIFIYQLCDTVETKQNSVELAYKRQHKPICSYI